MTNNEIKFVRSLSLKKFRDSLGLFVVEGRKLVREAQESGLELVNLYSEEKDGAEVMARISSMSSPSPCLAVVRKPQAPASVSSFKGLYLALDAIRDPGNLGTVIRIADWFGVSAVLASQDTAELYNPKVIQASMGSAFRVPVIYGDLPALLSEARAQAVPVLGTFLQGENIYGIELPQDAVLVMGNEANGISDEVARLCNTKITIPSFGSRAESLNVSVATAVCVSEFKRWKKA